ncbi:MAG: hypothetical protein NTZ56_09650 [Acidobacteria bacterium]|nr:hypothetical protein [Acidobacteriota bacterium]
MSERRKQLLEEAWVGDAVLALYARERILREDGRMDGEKFTRLTCNQFLSAMGEPTAVEAELGRLYQREGLAAAFQWIESKLIPLFQKHELRRTPPRHVRRAEDGLPS